MPYSNLDLPGSQAGAAGAGLAGGTATNGSGGAAAGRAGAGGTDAGTSAGSANVAGGAAPRGGEAGAGVPAIGGASPTESSAGAWTDGGGDAACRDSSVLEEAPLELPVSDMPGYLTGAVTSDSKATWRVGEGVDQRAFRVETPTALYYLHAASGAVVSISKDDDKVPQWIQYDWEYRADRGLPFLAGGCCDPPSDAAGASAPKMVTTRDAAKSSAKHQRIDSRSEDDAWQLTWDFYPTHATVTIEKSPTDYSFALRSKPNRGAQESDVAFWLSGADAAAPPGSADGQDLPALQWARLSERGDASESLFLIQHVDDCLPDSYVAPDYLDRGSTYEFSFGSGRIASGKRTRYSFGLSSSQKELAEARIDYVIAAMQ